MELIEKYDCSSMIEFVVGSPRFLTQPRGSQEIGTRYFYYDSDGCCSTDNIGPALLRFSAGYETFELWRQTLLYFKSMSDEFAEGEFRSTPSQSNPNVYKRRSEVQSQM